MDVSEEIGRLWSLERISENGLTGSSGRFIADENFAVA